MPIPVAVAQPVNTAVARFNKTINNLEFHGVTPALGIIEHQVSNAPAFLYPQIAGQPGASAENAALFTALLNAHCGLRHGLHEHAAGWICREAQSHALLYGVAGGVT